MPDLRNSAGEPTGAIYGMVNMMRRARTEIGADHIACVFDAKGKTFREDLYPEYKAHRSPMPEDLVAQIAPIHEVVKALGWPVLMISGVEADDVIGTLARQAAEMGWSTVISTGDKDLAQLVNDKVSLVNTMSNEKLDTQGVEAKFGVAPNRIVDYLTIVGDSVDNVPGVYKAGPKTANKWLAEYGDLDNVIAHAADIKGVVGDNLRASLDWLPKARELLTVKLDCDLTPHIASLHDLHAKPEDHDRLKELFEKYSFKTWLKEIGETGNRSKPNFATQGGDEVLKTPSQDKGDIQASPAAQNKPSSSHLSDLPRDYVCITDKTTFQAWLQKIEQASLTCIDTETTSLDAMQAELVG
ncbi:MAG: hypothetical protein RLZZ149_780, partial [Pseudomonadota bacterium]